MGFNDEWVSTTNGFQRRMRRSHARSAIEAGGGAARAVCCGPSEAAPAESVASAALRTGLRAWRLRLHPASRVLWTSRSGSGAVCRSDGIRMWQFERSRPEGRARATRRQWHRRGTHWVEHDVRHGCMSCARGQLWRDEGSLRQTTARLSGRRRRADACR
jgi:hypothetical protein